MEKVGQYVTVGGFFVGAMDAEGKQYLSNNEFFADAFNYLLYDGEEVIKPGELKELDTTAIAIPYGNNAKAPVQKYLDLLKIWNAMADENAIYILLGAELQSQVHYAMPVKNMLYDSIGYSEQVAKIGRANRKAAKASASVNADTEQNGDDRKTDGIAVTPGLNDEDGELVAENGAIKIKLSSAEFLSGFKKGDKLIPIITAVIYLGEEPWDGPRSLFDILDVKDDRLYKFLSDYKLNLISPANMDEGEFDKFKTDLGFAMRLIKHQSDDADKILMESGQRMIDAETAGFLNSAINLDLEIVEEKGGVNMCKAMEKKEKKDKITGAIEMLRLEGTKDDDIIVRVMKAFGVTKDYVDSLLTPQKAS